MPSYLLLSKISFNLNELYHRCISFFNFFTKKSNSSPTCRKPMISCYLLLKKYNYNNFSLMSYSYNSHPLAYSSNLVFFTLQIYYYLITFFTRSLNSTIYSIVSSFLVFIVFLTILISFEISYIILICFCYFHYLVMFKMILWNFG